MRRLTLLAVPVALLWGALPAAAQPQPPRQPLAPAPTALPARPDPATLVGTWKVDLRPTPAAPPYFQRFVVHQVHADLRFEGSFYGAPVSEGRINADWGTLRIAFVTADASGAYHHSAVLQGARLEGLTNSTGRGFLSYWSAERE